MKVIVAAAGTGGHINPGISIANKIKEKEPNSEIIFIGTNRGLEIDLVPRAGYELRTIEAYGLKNKITIENINHFNSTFASKKEVKKIIDEFKPDVIIGTGGYICIPVLSAAIEKNIPFALHESNAYPGLSLKLFSHKANLVMVGFEETISKLKFVRNAVYTGTPTKVKKISYSDEEKKNILKNIGVNGKLPVVLVYGGSQGASSINNAVFELLKNGNNDNFEIIWATGPKQYETIKGKFEDNNLSINNIKNAKILPYIYNMDELMNVVDLLVCRSGAMTVTEVSIVGKPAIFIPLPSKSANRQEDNARILENAGAAKIILNNNLSKDGLLNNIESIIMDKSNMKKMGDIALRFAPNNVLDRIYEEIIKII